MKARRRGRAAQINFKPDAALLEKILAIKAAETRPTLTNVVEVLVHEALRAREERAAGAA